MSKENNLKNFSEPNSKTKVILQNFQDDETLWFETLEQAGGYLTQKRIVDEDNFTCYELGKEIKFKVVVV